MESPHHPEWKFYNVLKRMYYMLFPPEELPIFHIGDRVRVFTKDKQRVLFIGRITKLTYPGEKFDEPLYGRLIEHDVLAYDWGPPYITGRVELEEKDGGIDEDRNYFVFQHPIRHRVELLPPDIPLAKQKELSGDAYEPGKYD